MQFICDLYVYYSPDVMLKDDNYVLYDRLQNPVETAHAKNIKLYLLLCSMKKK